MIRSTLRSIKKRLWSCNIPHQIPEIVRTIGHDEHAFTQGLAYDQGQLFESTGIVGHSSVRKLDELSGEIVLSRDLPDHHAEGIACSENEITQLTWQAGLVFVYRADNLEPLRTHTFTGEGWGLASWDSGFICTDGSDTVFFRDRDFHVVRELKIKMNGVGLRWLNDLVFVAGKLYLNRLGDTRIFEASAQSGAVSRIIDCSSLIALVNPLGPEDFLNGITYIPAREEFVVTGKRWNMIFFLKF